MRQISLLAVTALLALTAQAHHSNAPHFDTDIELEKVGVVTDWKLVNPHAFIYFDVTNDDSSVSQWKCETDAGSSLKKRNFTEDTFVAGETITVIGNPARREDNHCFFRDFVFADGTIVGRNTDLASLNRGTTTAEPDAPAETITAVLLGDEPDISGYWSDSADVAVSAPAAPNPGGGMGMGISPDGSLPPRLARIASIGLTPTGQEIQDKYERIYDDPALHCEISNIIDALGRDDTVNLIRQNGDSILFHYGYMDYARTIHLNMEAHPENIEPTPGGHSIGKWEGDTLVIDTIGFTPSLFNAQVGIPTSESFHVVERISYSQETETLEREYVATDSENWTDSYSGSDTYYRSSIAYSAYNCETLSGLNNLRPGTPEYEAEVARIAAAAESAGAETPEILDTSSGMSQDKLTLTLIAIATLVIIMTGFVLGRRKGN
eukprot:g4445.t1